MQFNASEYSFSEGGSFKPKAFSMEKIKPGSFAHHLVSECKGPQDIISKILTKNGSKDFQKALTFSNQMNTVQKQELEQLVEFLVDSILAAGCFSNLLIHQYGNYFCQKLFPRLSNEQKLRLWKELELDMPNYLKPVLPQIEAE